MKKNKQTKLMKKRRGVTHWKHKKKHKKHRKGGTKNKIKTQGGWNKAGGGDQKHKNTEKMKQTKNNKKNRKQTNNNKQKSVFGCVVLFFFMCVFFSFIFKKIYKK